ncbi:hypothetical protein B1729_14565 [Microbacterium sp. B35-04]|uniref:hypothetical protein n=1 Tax=Microbacterium sp. B35-04 TaxID=1961716 RepID=UPI0013D6B8B5|nr:hypothetical protein [Microbacterium sp. B35-04]KAF2412532.1 hypothetical protein B1729_14565 [Microbacterium sp. B35-04]
MRGKLCNLLFSLFGHRVCCGRIPAWTAHVGQRWDTYDLAPLNLYNAIWRVQDWIRSGMTG